MYNILYRDAWKEFIGVYAPFDWFASLTFSQSYLTYKSKNKKYSIKEAKDTLSNPIRYSLNEDRGWKQFYRWKARLEASLGSKAIYFATLESGKVFPHLHILLKHPNFASIKKERWEYRWLIMDEGNGSSKILPFEMGAISYILKRINNINDGSTNIKFGIFPIGIKS